MSESLNLSGQAREFTWFRILPTGSLFEPQPAGAAALIRPDSPHEKRERPLADRYSLADLIAWNRPGQVPYSQKRTPPMSPADQELALSTLVNKVTRPALIGAAGAMVGMPEAGLLDAGIQALPENWRSLASLLGMATVRAYHGTTGDFERFDPSRTTDIGMHFGTAEQANNAIASGIRGSAGEYPQGANVRPVDLDIEKTLRMPDVFSILGKGMTPVARKLTLETPGLRFEDADRTQLFDYAKRLDTLKRKAGGIRSWQDPMQSTLLSAAQKAEYEAAYQGFWKTVEKGITSSGYDSAVYNNKVEGKGDSYIMFDHTRISPAFGEEK